MAQYIGLDIPFQSGGSSFTANLVVVPASLDSSYRIIPGVAAPTATIPPLGVVVDNTDSTLGQLPIVRVGGVIDCVAGAAIDPHVQPQLTWDSSGRVIPVGSSTGTTYPTIGTALEGCTTLGDKVSVLVSPGSYTHP